MSEWTCANTRSTCGMNVPPKKQAQTIRAIMVLVLIAFSLSCFAGKYPYAEFQDTISNSAGAILKKYGLPVAYDRENPWFYISAIPGSYTLKFHQSSEIPQQAVLDIIKLCMDYYEHRGRAERFRIVMYRESHEQWRKSLFLGIGSIAGVKPYFELTIGRNEK